MQSNKRYKGRKTNPYKVATVKAPKKKYRNPFRAKNFLEHRCIKVTHSMPTEWTKSRHRYYDPILDVDKTVLDDIESWTCDRWSITDKYAYFKSKEDATMFRLKYAP